MLNPGKLPTPNLPTKFMYNVISTEALSVHKPVAATVQKLAGFINNVADGFKNTDILGALDTLLKKDNNFSKNEKKVLEILSRQAYSDIMDIRVPCVNGLSVPWLDFLHDMDPAIQFAVGFYDNTLGQTTRFLAEVITSPDKMESIARRYNVQDVDYERLTQNIGKDVRGGNGKAERPLGKLVKRNADMIDVITLTNRFSESLYASNQDLVTERITQIKRQLQDISEGMVDPNTPYRMTGKNIDALAKVAYNVAQAVEYYGVVITLFTEHKRTFEQAVEKLARLEK
jgi:hypothetical protein